MKIIKRVMNLLFSDVQPTHVCPETGEFWVESDYFGQECPFSYQRVTESKLGVWTKQTAWLGKWNPLVKLEATK